MFILLYYISLIKNETLITYYHTFQHKQEVGVYYLNHDIQLYNYINYYQDN